MVPGRYRERVEQTKALFNVATASPTRLAVAEFLDSGGYDKHLRAVRRAYAHQVAEMRDAIGRRFPDQTRVSRPEGGFVLWVEMPASVEGLAVYHQIFTVDGQQAPASHFLRLAAQLPPSC